MSLTQLPTTVIPLTHGWTFRKSDETESSVVSLPHDAMISERRDGKSPGAADIAWFYGGHYVYTTTWRPEAIMTGQEITLYFEGVQGDGRVLVNDIELGTIRSGYTEFEVRIDDALEWDSDNTIEIRVDNSKQPNSRWYPGSGLYRPVSIVARGKIHFAADGVAVRTRRVGNPAEVDVVYTLVNPDATALEITAELRSHGALVAQAQVRSTTGGAVSLVVPDARLWSAEDPFLYDCVVRAESNGTLVDEWTHRIGLRTIEVDAKKGLRVNGKSVLLRGACIHHDNGILGAATHEPAEHRRVKVLKESGFNAIRSSHNAVSRAILRACDELGVYVMDELTDYWEFGKSTYDAASRFLDTWREDVDSLVAKDRNHASVIMYSIGNEIPESGKPEGAIRAREIADYFRSLDAERPTTAGVNTWLNILTSINALPQKGSSPDGPARLEEPSDVAGSAEGNSILNKWGWLMDIATKLPKGDAVTRGAFEALDVAGYNYGLLRYRQDARTYPDRVIVGSETLPGSVAKAWKLVEWMPAVIGDFVWTGWEYLGEAGLGSWVPGKKAGLAKPYPHLIGGAGMIDLIGNPDFSLRLAQAAWGVLEAPAIAVRPVNQSGEDMVRTTWRSTDAVESWSWSGCEGRLAEIEVCAVEDEVELFLNGRSIGKKKTGPTRNFTAHFRAPYEPGELVAVGRRAGKEVSRSVVRTAGPDLRVSLAMEGDTLAADNDSLAFIRVQITDAAGETEMLADDEISLEVQGPATLVAFGSAAPATTESFTDSTHRTYRGRSLAILRSTGDEGTVRLLATSSRTGKAELELKAVSAGGALANDPQLQPAAKANRCQLAAIATEIHP